MSRMTKNKLKNEVLVSIWCTTYNHEMFIKDAIEGFLAQKTNFEYEIIIHDDASTDNTAKIIEKYEKMYPDKIHCIYQEENQRGHNYPHIGWLQKIKEQNCKGKYIALCEGDDFWIDIQKLQLQVDYLESHPDCVMTVHDAVNVDYRDYTIKSGSIYEKDCIVSPGDLIVQNKYMFTASIVYRREMLQIDGFFSELGIGDYPCLLYSLTKGNIFYFSRIMSVYRQHHEGSWSHAFLENKELQWDHSIRMLDFLEEYNKFTDNKYKTYITSRIHKSVTDILTIYSESTEKEFVDACRKYVVKMDGKYSYIFTQLKRIRRQLFDKAYLDDDVERFVRKYPIKLIMGAGRYAGIVAEQLNSNGIKFEAFVVSDDQETNGCYLEKPVWKLSQMPFDVKDVGVVVGINPIMWEEVYFSLCNKGIENYITPFCWKFNR